MKKRFFGSDRVVLKDWARLKPYPLTGPTAYDRYFLGLCNEVFDILETYSGWLAEGGAGRGDRKNLACVLVSYFEDFLSEIGLWPAFLAYNEAILGRRLPFFDLAEHDTDHINVADLQFLIWHFLYARAADVFAAPDDPVITELSERICELFEDNIDDGPATDFYDEFFAVRAGDDFFKFKEKLDWLASRSWLLGPNNELRLLDDLNELEKAVKARRSDVDPETVNSVVYSMRDSCLYRWRSPLSAIAAPELMARTARADPAKKAEIEAMHEWARSVFLIEKDLGDRVGFRCALTGGFYETDKTSFRTSNWPKALAEAHAFEMSLVRWNGVWQLTGMAVQGPQSSFDLPKRRAGQLPSPWMQPADRLQQVRESTDLMERAFRETHGGPFVLHRNGAEANEATKVFFDRYHAHIKDKNGPDNEEDFEARRAIFGEKNGLEQLDWAKAIGSQAGGIFFIAGVGMLDEPLAPRAAALLSSEKQLDDQQAQDLFFMLAEKMNPMVAQLLLDHFGWKNVRFPRPESAVDLPRDLAAFWRAKWPEEFGAVYPNLTMVDVS